MTWPVSLRALAFTTIALSLVVSLAGACSTGDANGQAQIAMDLTHAAYESPSDLLAASEAVVEASLTSAPFTTVDSDEVMDYVAVELAVERVIGVRPDMPVPLVPGQTITAGFSLLDATASDRVINWDELSDDYPTTDELPQSGFRGWVFLVATPDGPADFDVVSYGVGNPGEGLKLLAVPGPVGEEAVAFDERDAVSQLCAPAPWRAEEPGGAEVPVTAIEDDDGRPPLVP